jgi:ferredoxin
MAREDDAITANVSGEFFVDSSCIDCDLCRQIAPAVFARSDRAGQSYVAHQPGSPGEHRALMALVTCPTSSIGTRTKHDARAAARAFPEPVIGDVLFCGYASESSYGAASYLIRRPGGNVLVDSPRFARVLAERPDVDIIVSGRSYDPAPHAGFCMSRDIDIASQDVRDRVARIWDVYSGQLIHVLSPVHENEVHEVAFARDGGMPTLSGRKKSAKAARFESVMQEPLVRAVLDRFPGAEVVAVRDMVAEEEVAAPSPDDDA